MLELETKQREFAIEKQDVGLLISNEVFLPLILQLPPTAELHEIKKLLFNKISADEIYGQLDEDSRNLFRIERDQLLKKYDKYKESPTFLSHLATLTEFSGDLNGMADVLRSGSEIDSSNFHIHRMARAFMALNNLPEAAKAFGKANLKTDADANLGLACLAILQGNYNEALTFVNSALDIDEANFNALLLAGVLELGRNHSDRAIRYFRSAIEERTTSAAPYVLLGTAYYRTGRRDRALAMFKRAVALNPIDANAVILYADTLLLAERYAEVVRVLEDYIQFEQKSVTAWDRLGRAFYHLGNYTRALSALKHQASILENCGVWNNIALVHWRMGDQKRASNYLSLALKKTLEEGFPTFLPFYNTFIFFREIGSLQDAIAVTEMIPRDRISDLAKTSVASSLLTLRCEALAEVGRIDEAARELDALLNAKDVHRELRLSVLQTATFFYSLYKPDMERALHCAHIALDELRKGDIDDEKRGLLLNNIVFVLLEFGNTEEADKHISKLSPWIHKSAPATATLGMMHLRKGHLELGKRFYGEAIALVSDRRLKARLKQKMHLELGRLLLQQGQTRAAARFLKEAAASDLAGVSSQASSLLKLLS